MKINEICSYAVISLIFVTCSINKSFVHVTYKLQLNGKKTIRMKIPKGFEQQNIAGSHELEQRYWYSDSAVIYITNDKSISELNYDKIYKLGDLFYKRQFRADTLTISGIKNGLYWKDVKYSEFSIGYANVPNRQKQLFDQALRSIDF